MARSTAKERLRVACELQRRPLLADALKTGSVSYSKVRALTRIARTDAETDRALLVAADAGTAADMERLARHAALIEEQERPVDAVACWQRRGLRTTQRYGGMATVEAVLSVDQAERLVGIVDAVARERKPVEKASAEATEPGALWGQRRLDALCELVEVGFANLDAAEHLDPESAAVDVIVDYEVLCERAGGTAQLGGGQPVRGEAARRLACDAGLTRIIVKGRSEVLDVGRRSRQWNRAQRHAIRYRHNHRCAYPACDHRITQIHHSKPWKPGGSTDLATGVPLCWGHHHLVHEGGWTVAYNPADGTTVFTGPQGQTVCAKPVPPPLAVAG
jgi:hypothetical protein